MDSTFTETLSRQNYNVGVCECASVCVYTLVSIIVAADSEMRCCDTYYGSVD
jgi:hypothetical protein